MRAGEEERNSILQKPIPMEDVSLEFDKGKKI